MNATVIMLVVSCIFLMGGIAFLMHLLHKKEVAQYEEARRVYMLTLELDARRFNDQDKFHQLEMDAQKKLFDEQLQRDQERFNYEKKFFEIQRLEQIERAKEVMTEMASDQHQAELFGSVELSNPAIPTKILCGICREDLIHKKGELIKCLCCGVIYHTACVAFNHGRCSTYGCKASKRK